MEGGTEGRDIWIFMTDPAAVRQKGVRHCKAIILQFRNKLQNKVTLLVGRVSRV